jgi:hypothetical protein
MTPLSLSRSKWGEEGKRDVLQITPVTSILCIEAELRCRGFESVERFGHKSRQFFPEIIDLGNWRQSLIDAMAEALVPV